MSELFFITMVLHGLKLSEQIIHFMECGEHPQRIFMLLGIMVKCSITMDQHGVMLILKPVGPLKPFAEYRPVKCMQSVEAAAVLLTVTTVI